jgi:hypothetical protein
VPNTFYYFLINEEKACWTGKSCGMGLAVTCKFSKVRIAGDFFVKPLSLNKRTQRSSVGSHGADANAGLRFGDSDLGRSGFSAQRFIGGGKMNKLVV